MEGCFLTVVYKYESNGNAWYPGEAYLQWDKRERKRERSQGIAWLSLTGFQSLAFYSILT
jgi:hypothetical protein